MFIANPTHSYGHIACPECERARKLTLSRIVPSLTFAAAELWLESKSISAPNPLRTARFIKENTKVTYRECIASLNLFFANLCLDQIHMGHLRQYQEARVSGAPPFIRKRRPNRNCVAGPCPAGPRKCNAEPALLKRIMGRAGCWTAELAEYYEPFQEDLNDVPRALSPEEQQRWLAVAASRQEWWIVYWYSLLAFETSMGTNEMRSLRCGDVNLYYGIVKVPPEGAKNKYRGRTIPLLTAEAKWAAEQLMERAKDLGAKTPLDYVFPFRFKNTPYNPSRPMTVSGIKRFWEEVRHASGLTWFRPYDTRHTAITRWAEQGKQISDIMAMAGHVNRRMTEHYTHISEQARRKMALEVAGRMAPASDRQGWAAPFYVRRA